MSMTVLITGASSEIGLEMARICAAARHDVVLVARSARNLAELAAARERDHGVRANVIDADLSSAEGVERVVTRVGELRLTIEVAGSGVTVTALCPGPTASNFQTTARLEDSKLVFGKTLPTSR